jgi:dTDP-4-dehydrorhamnose 3,5-epimerase
MKFRETELSGCFVLEPTVFADDRGYFFESFNSKKFAEEIGYLPDFVQDNQSRSSKGVLRGLHLQKGNSAQAKLVRALEGEIFDVAVDLRPDSNTFQRYFGCVLSAENKQQLFVPRGFAHGFAVLSDFATIHYKADNFYDQASESGVIFNDPDLNIDWQISGDEILTSEKDLLLPTMAQFIQQNLL